MNIESKLLAEIWDTIEDQINRGQRVDVAMALIRSFIDYGMELVDFEEACDENNYLNAAYKNLEEPDIDMDGDYDDDD